MERFQNRKPNKKDHQKIRKTAKGGKAGAAFFTGVIAVGIFIKKHGKDMAKIAKSAIFKL